MLAVRVHEYGGPERLVLEQIPVPVPGAGQALVRVVAAGSDIAGVIERLGDAATRLHVGDAIYGLTNQSFTGGYAQYALAST